MSRRHRMTRKLSAPSRNPARRARRHRPAAERSRAYAAHALGRAALDQAFGRGGPVTRPPRLAVPGKAKLPAWMRRLQRRHSGGRR
jgi:hypothetical protein